MAILSLNAATFRPPVASSADNQVYARAIERLSTGSRINRVQDDPATLNVSQGLQRQARSQTSAARNANDAISMIQTADAGLNNIQAMLQEIYGLSVRSVNESFTQNQRKLIGSRISDLRSEINATVERTKFNNIELLRGDFTTSVRGRFDSYTGGLNNSTLAVHANSSFQPASSSTLNAENLTTLRVSDMLLTGAQRGDYKFSTNDSTVTLTRTVDGVTAAQSITLVSGASAGANQVQVPQAAGDKFSLDFSALGVAVEFLVTNYGTRNSTADFAAAIGSIGSVPSTTGWRAVSDLPVATGNPTDQVVATIRSTGGNLRLGVSAGLNPVSGFGAASTWSDGSTATIGFTGTVAQVNAALQTLEVNATDGLGTVDVALTAQFKNNVFLDTTGMISDPATNKTVLPGWEIYTKRAILGSTVIGGVTSSNNDNAMPTGSRVFATPAYLTANYASFNYNSASFNYELTTDMPIGVTGKSLRLYSNMQTSSGSEVIHGPYMVSDDSVSIKAGDSVSFWWKSANGSDAYDSYAYLVNVDTSTQIELLDSTAPSDASIVTPWTKVTQTVNTPGNYKFVFVAGTFDYSGGQAAGGSLYLTDIQVTPAVPEASAQRAVNLGTGGEFAIDSALAINSVSTQSPSGAVAPDGRYRAIADSQAKTITLNHYYDNSSTLIKSQTIDQGEEVQGGQSRTYEFNELGVSLTVGNQSVTSLWLGANSNTLETETTITENQRLSVDGTAPSFKIGDGSKFEFVLSELRDVRLGDNDDPRHSETFNRLDQKIRDLAASTSPSLESFGEISRITESALELVTELRSELGVAATRLSASVNNIDSQVSSISSNRNRIESTDYAQETSRLVRLQANQSAYLATLAHMNTQPQMVLWLLQ
jgi:flagellin-like hook-associated protein FlgL